jgi:hypothetical protein
MVGKSVRVPRKIHAELQIHLHITNMMYTQLTCVCAARPRTSGYQHYAEAFEHYERQPVGRFPGQVQQASAHERAAKEGWSNDIRLVMGPEQADQGAEAERRKEQIFARMMAMPPCLKCKTQYVPHSH